MNLFQTSPVALARIGSLVKWIGTIGGALVGLGAAAFAAGYLAERAQHEVARVPFVFIDYWAYAETGLNGLRDSMLALGPYPILLLVVISIALIWSLEFTWWRSVSSVPELLVLGHAAFAVCAIVILHQELAVGSHTLARVSPIQDTRPDAEPIRSDSSPLTVTWPFRWFIRSAAYPPLERSFSAGSSAVAAWQQMADDLEAMARDERTYFATRPRPSWALPPRVVGTPPTPSLLGVTVADVDLDEQRALQLYRHLVRACLLLLWLLALLYYWDKAVFANLQRSASTTTSGGSAPAHPSVVTSLRWRLKEELWYSAHAILRPVSVALTVFVFLLLPEAYGVLAIPRVGHELVDVIVSRKPGADAHEHGGDGTREFANSRANSRAIAKVLDAVSRGIDEFPIATAVEREEMTQKWSSAMDAVERLGDASAIEPLSHLVLRTRLIAPPLSELADNVTSRLTAQLGLPSSGYILSYPRSDRALRLIARNGSAWSIQSIDESQVVEVRVKRDQTNEAFIEGLRSLRNLSELRRAKALLKLSQLGHPRTLEMWMAATSDSSSIIRGDAITQIAKYAVYLPPTTSGEFRRRRALLLLLELTERSGIDIGQRGTAVTSLQYVAHPRDADTCTRLVAMFKDRTAKDSDPYWELRGTAVSTLGQIQCRGAASILTALVNSDDVPLSVRLAIPTALLHLNDADAVKGLTTLVSAPGAPAALRGAGVLALAGLGCDRPTTARTILNAALQLHGDEADVVEAREMSMNALGQCGFRIVAGGMRPFTDRESERSEKVRVAALEALDLIDSPESEPAFMAIAEDANETEDVRTAAISALDSSHEEEIVRRLEVLFHRGDCTSALKKMIRYALHEQGHRGSGRARAAFERLGGTDDETSDETEGSSDASRSVTSAESARP